MGLYWDSLVTFAHLVIAAYASLTFHAYFVVNISLFAPRSFRIEQREHSPELQRQVDQANRRIDQLEQRPSDKDSKLNQPLDSRRVFTLQHKPGAQTKTSSTASYFARIAYSKALESFGQGKNSEHVLPSHLNPSKHPRKSDLAILTLTSGTTANAKAVRLTHQQVITAIEAKSVVRHLPPDIVFLNWIGLGHDQVHVPAANVVSSPRIFVDHISRHRVSRTFAPDVTRTVGFGT